MHAEHARDLLDPQSTTSRLEGIMSARVLRLALFCSAPVIAVLALGCDQPETPLAQKEQALGSCVTATASQTQAISITPPGTEFEAFWEVTPTAGTDSGVGFTEVTNPTPGDWTQLATIVRFSGSQIDVRDGATYHADALMNWTGGSKYKVRMIVNVQTDRYSVFVTGPTGNEQTLATDYAFRFPAGQLTRSVAITSTGSITACGPAISSCFTAGAGGNIANAFPQQSGSFSVSWDMTPVTSTIDAAVALSSLDNPTDWTHLATIVRFAQSPSNLIDARNGPNYEHAITIPWAVNGNYRVRLAVNTSTVPPSYSIYVTSPGGSEQILGTSYAFRDGQQSSAPLKTWVVKSSAGSARACNFQYTGNVSVSVSPSAPTVAPSGNQTFTATVTNASNTDVTWSVTEGASGGSVTSGGVYTAPSTAGTYHVKATSVTDPTKFGTATVTVSSTTTYDSEVLADTPVAYWRMSGGTSEADLTPNNHTGTYLNGPLPTVQMPNGESVVKFSGTAQVPQYLSVPDHDAFSIPTTGELTWEVWIRPDPSLQFPYANYSDFIGKCQNYSPTCEWEGRMYNTTVQSEPDRCNRISAYVFNNQPLPGDQYLFGSAADWQPVCGQMQPNRWYHVVGRYTTLNSQNCTDTSPPGSIDIWVNGVKWSRSAHHPTGCMSQYNVTPTASTSGVRIGTMANNELWFHGAIGKVAIYDKLLSETRIRAHYTKMSGLTSSGTCGDNCTISPWGVASP
jgi:hypothetical protein